MNQDISLWSPVILASLTVPRDFQQVSRYRTSEMMKRIEDIKVRIKNPRAVRQGRRVEVRVNLEIIALVEDYQGHSQVFSRQEVVRDRLEMREFDQSIEQNEVSYIVQIQDLTWDGDLQDKELTISYFFSYLLYAAQEQVVKLYAQEETLTVEPESDQEVKVEIDRVRTDNEILSRKLFLYERDLTSLRRGIKKVEDRNAFISRELDAYQEQVQKLRETITRKDLLICEYVNHQSLARENTTPIYTGDGEVSTLGKRIKRMFLSSL